MAAGVLQNKINNVVERLQTSTFAHSSAQRQTYCDFSLRTSAEAAIKAVMQTLPQPIEAACYLDTRVSWIVRGCEPSGLKRIFLHLAEFYSGVCDDLAVLLLRVTQSAPRPPSAEEAALQHGAHTARAMLDTTFEMRALRADGQPARLVGASMDLQLWLGGADSATVPPVSNNHGLSLWFAQRLVTSLRGVTAVSDHGASCAFCVPYEQPSTVLPPLRTEPTPAVDLSLMPVHHRPKVLVVER